MQAFGVEGVLAEEATNSVRSQMTLAPSSDLDAEVLDIKMRADSGAKSKLSTSLYFNYAGSSLESPFDDKRPNVGEGRFASPVSAAWNLGVRDRLNKNESVFFAAGFSRSRPFSAREADEREVEVSTPQIMYNNTSGSDHLQLSSSVRVYITTLEFARKIGEVGTVGYSVSAMTKSQTRFNAGLTLNTWITAYNKSDDALKTMQNDYGVGLIPLVQYIASDKLNAYSSWSVWNYYHFRSENPTTFERLHVTQTIGAGYALLRDVYLSPYLSFYTSDIASDKTSVNFSATINL